MSAERLVIVGNQAAAMRNFRGPLIAALVAKGVEVHALAPDYDEADRDAILAVGATPVDYPLRRAGISPVGDVRSTVALTSLLRQIKPDVVLSFSAKPVIYGTVAAALARVPRRYALVEGLGHAFLGGPGLKSRLLQATVSALYRFSLGLATKTFFLNADDVADFVGAGLVRKDRAERIGAIGIDLASWAATAPVSNPLTFLFVGRLLREKGIFEFIEAARAVHAKHPAARFVVLGAPDSNPSSISAEQMQAWVAEGFVSWPGHVDVKPHLASASVFVLPSYREGVPRSTQEAMAMGKPVITTDVPGCRDTVVDGDNGFLIEAKSAAAIERAMLRFVADPTLVASMGARSRRLAEERFDVHRANARIIAAMGL